MTSSAKAFAPASIGNFAVGFDILGMAIGDLGDMVTVTLRGNSGDRKVIIESIEGIVDDLPFETVRNTASVALTKMVQELDLPHGFSLNIEKGIPLGSGLGGSASSAVAAVVAANSLLENPQQKQKLFQFALAGEAIASGGIHGDNVAPSLYGGLTLCVGNEIDGFKVQGLPFPGNIHLVMAHQQTVLETKQSRSVLKSNISLAGHVEQSMNLAGFISGIYTNDRDWIFNSIRDVLIEPQRSPLIPNFTQMRDACLNNGSVGFSISGAGPTVFSVCPDNKTAEKNKDALEKVLSSTDLSFNVWKTEIDNTGAKLLTSE
jgi:homoserine kinase